MNEKYKYFPQGSRLCTSLLLALAMVALAGAQIKTLAADAGETTRGVITHESGIALVEVTVVATNDLKPLAGVKVSSWPSNAHTNVTAYTDANGVARFHLPVGTNLFYARGRDWFPQRTIAEVVESVTNCVTLELTPAPRITGIVREPSGAPAPNVLVSFHPGQFPDASDYVEVRTDENGRYVLILQVEGSGVWWGPGNPINFILARDFQRNFAAIQEFTAIPTNLDLNLQPGITLSGSVKDTNGAPITRASADLRILSGQSLVELEPQPIEVDSQGRFSIPALPQGRDYELFNGIVAPDYVPASGRLKAEDSKTSHYEFPTFVLVPGHVNQIRL